MHFVPRISLMLFLVVLVGGISGAADKGKVPDSKLVDKFTEASMWVGLSRNASDKHHTNFEASFKITSRDGDKFTGEYWVTIGANQGGHDRRGLLIKGTINEKGEIHQARASKILAGAWQDPNILTNRWEGRLIQDDPDTVRLQLVQFTSKTQIENGLIRR